MKRLLQLSIVALSVALALLSWFAALMPFWLTQSGDRDGAYYSQGLGLWLNYTEHAGVASFDPGNSLWVPPQRSAAQSYADQCAASRKFCDGAVGQLQIQYCEVMEVYCGAATTALQISMSVVAGLAVLTVVWAVKSIAVAHRTAADRFLMHLCVTIGVLYLGVVVLWYFAVYRIVLDTTFYKDQYNRCNENPTDRKCWQVGFCVYLAIAGGILYPLLSLMVVHHVTDKFRRYQRLLRRLFESATMVDLPDPMVTLKAESMGDDPLASADVAIELETQLRSQTLQPLRTVPSAVRPEDQSEIEIDDSIDELDDSVQQSSRLKPSSPATGSHHVAV